MATSRRTTIADVAADAGVGVGTGSRVLNGSRQVRADTVRSVQEAIGRLGYRPSHAAAALVRGTPRTVAVLVSHLTRPSAAIRAAGALAVLEEQGYGSIVCNVDTPPASDTQAMGVLLAAGRLGIDVPGEPRASTAPLTAGPGRAASDPAGPG